MSKMVEISESDLLESQKARDTLRDLMRHPTARRKVLEAYKEMKPDEPIPELDAQKPVLDAVTEVRKEYDAKFKKLEDDREKERTDARTSEMNSRWEAGRKRLRSDHRYTDDGIKLVEEMMEKKGIVDHEDGRMLFEAIHPPQAPMTPGGSSGAFNFLELPQDGADDLKKLIETKGESMPLLDKMTREALAETRGSGKR